MLLFKSVQGLFFVVASVYTTSIDFIFLMPPRTPRTIRAKAAVQSPAVTETPTLPSGTKRESFWPVVLTLSMLLLIALTVAGYFYYQYSQSAAVVNAKEIAHLSETIGAMMLLPEGETPTLATVTDREKLSGQPFFQKAENGDKVLIYQSAGRAILFRPGATWYDTGKIIDVTTVNVNEPVTSTPMPEPVAPTPPTEPTPAVAAPVAATIALYNGSTKIGATNAIETDIIAQFPDAVAVTVKEKAAKNDYQGDIIIDLSGRNADLAARLATSIGGTVGTLPENEVVPAADILIIVGNR
jgi:hypothetical protein